MEKNRYWVSPTIWARELRNLANWAKQAAPYPVVAIGGVSLERLPGVLACGVNGVAVVSAVTLADDPERAVRDALGLF